MKSFFDFTASDLIQTYQLKEKAEADLKIAKLQSQGRRQAMTMNAPVIDNAQVANDTGFANRRPAMPAPAASYFERIPKGPLYGGFALLALALVAKKVI